MSRVVAAWVLLAAACEPSRAEPRTEPARPVLGARSTTASTARARPESTAWLPGPARRSEARDPRARLALETGCRSCHDRVSHQWSRSQHATSWTDPPFQRAFALEPSGFCQRCHAPEEDPAAEPGAVSSAASTIAVGCVTCHVEPGSDIVLAAPGSARAEPEAPHPIARTSAFAGADACRGCHQFDFPDAALRRDPLPMQSTLAEHLRSSYRDHSCASCHMPTEAGGRRDHAFIGAHDEAMLRRSLEIEAARPDPSTITIRLAPGRVGHAVPTGDLLRRLAVEIHVDDDEGRPGFRDARYFGRRFAPRPQPSGITLRDEVADDRVGAGPDGGVRVARFSVPAELSGRPVRWRVLHQRVAHGSLDPRRAIVDGETTIAEGWR